MLGSSGHGQVHRSKKRLYEITKLHIRMWSLACLLLEVHLVRLVVCTSVGRMLRTLNYVNKIVYI